MSFSCILLSFYFDIQQNELFLDIKKIQKYSGIFVDLFMISSRVVLFYFFSLRIVFLCCMFNLQTITVKCESFMQCIFFFLSKKSKQKKVKGIKKIVSSSIKNPNLANLFTGTRVRNIAFFWFVQYLSMPVQKIFVSSKCSLMLES